MFRTYRDVTRSTVPINENKGGDDIQEGAYRCDLCSDTEEGWASETEVMLHRAYEHKKYIDELFRSKDFICKMCMTVFGDEDALLCHIKSDHLLSTARALRVERRIFACDACGALFFNKLMLAHHIHCAHASTVCDTDSLAAYRNKQKCSRFKCPVCWRQVRFATWWYHFRAHKLQSITCCKICLKKFKNRAALTEHLKTHPPLYRCEICGYDTKKEGLYHDHIKTVHNDDDASEEAAPSHSNVDRYFILPDAVNKWRKLNLMGWRGLRLTNDVSVCALCRHVCAGAARRRRHIRAAHAAGAAAARLACGCGALFSSRLLLRHHRFKHHRSLTDCD